MKRDRTVASGSTIEGGGTILISPSRVPKTGSVTGVRHRSGPGCEERDEYDPDRDGECSRSCGCRARHELAQPGCNFTGLSRQTRDIVGKDLQLLKEVSPEIVRVGVRWEPYGASQRHDGLGCQGSRKLLGVQLEVLEVGGLAQLEGAFWALQAERVGAVLVLEVRAAT
jgi:hypothetical protein